MADFRVHLYGAAATSGLATLAVHGLGWTGPRQAQLLFLLGVAGGLLPDIDAPQSTPVRLGVFELFSRYTVHRGIWHSWLAALGAGLASTNLAHHAAGLPAWESWLAGAFVTLGYLTHLCLDEIASVDLLGRRIKRSFGTALKPFSLAYPWASLAMLVAVLLLGVSAPPVAPVLAVADHYGLDRAGILARLQDKGDWLNAWASALVPRASGQLVPLRP